MANIIYENREIEGEQLELTDNKEGNYYLGPNLTLRRCTVVIGVTARWLHILPTRFIDCTIHVKRELKHFQWMRANFKGCQFKGRMTGCDFGRWPQWFDGWEHGAIEDCDFTEARLANCRFHGCDTRTLRFPRWPCFTILDPVRRSPELARMKWPGKIGPVIMENLFKDPPSTVAVTLYAPTTAQRHGTTPEAIKAVLDTLEGVVY